MSTPQTPAIKTFLDINDMKINCAPEDIFAWAMEMAIGTISREELTEKLRSN